MDVVIRLDHSNYAKLKRVIDAYYRKTEKNREIHRRDKGISNDDFRERDPIYINMDRLAFVDVSIDVEIKPDPSISRTIKLPGTKSMAKQKGVKLVVDDEDSEVLTTSDHPRESS